MRTTSVSSETSVTRRPIGVPDTRSINYLNIGLIFASFVIALYLPFQLFLFAYAILGPGHYLTEVSWLQKRRYFAKGSYDGWVLAGLALIPSFFAAFTSGPLKQIGSSQNMAGVICLAFGSGLVFFLARKPAVRIAGFATVAAVSFLAVSTSAFVVMLFALFVPTLIHVYIFTGLFMIFGALKERSKSGYLSLTCFLICPLLYLFIHPAAPALSDSMIQGYWHPFSGINTALLGLPSPHSQAQMDQNVARVFGSQAGLTAMRFIAFAYTYHYLNWFSKTGIIKWHKISAGRMSSIAGIWIVCIALYFINYSVAMKVLFTMSVIHVFLEFPLNHMSIIGIWRELHPTMGAPGDRVLQEAHKISGGIPSSDKSGAMRPI